MLAHIRREASKVTVRNLALEERDPWDIEGGPFKFLSGARAFPLVPVTAGRSLSRFSEINELALDTASALPQKAWGVTRTMVIALIETRVVNFATVHENSLGKRKVEAIRTLSAPPGMDPVMFTD